MTRMSVFLILMKLSYCCGIRAMIQNRKCMVICRTFIAIIVELYCDYAKRYSVEKKSISELKCLEPREVYVTILLQPELHYRCSE